MRQVTSVALACLLLASSGATEQDKKKPADKKGPLVVSLVKVPVKKGSLRPGHLVKGEMPANAWQAKVGGDTLLFVDLDGNDELAPGTDGLAMPTAGPFVVPLQDTLLLKSGQYKLAFEGTKQVTLTAEDLGTAQGYVAEASVFTEIRLRAGLRPAVLDPKMCADCDKHCDYLKANGFHVQDGGKSPTHEEDPAKPGYTAEGDAAGRASCVFKARNELRRSITSWFSTPFHGCTMLYPDTDRIGVTTKNSVCMLYLGNVTTGFGEIYVHPPDGAVGIPTALGNGDDMEFPNPVPGTQNGLGCGFPITVLLNGRYTDVESAEILDAGGKPVKGTWSTPKKPANPSRPENKGCVFFVPSKPLAGNTLHKVTIKFPGGDKPLTWSFTTGAK
jgi:hypothetical protein